MQCPIKLSPKEKKNGKKSSSWRKLGEAINQRFKIAWIIFAINISWESLRIIQYNITIMGTILKMWNINRWDHPLNLDEETYPYFCHDKCLTEDKCKRQKGYNRL